MPYYCPHIIKQPANTILQFEQSSSLLSDIYFPFFIGLPQHSPGLEEVLPQIPHLYAPFFSFG